MGRVAPDAARLERGAGPGGGGKALAESSLAGGEPPSLSKTLLLRRIILGRQTQFFFTFPKLIQRIKWRTKEGSRGSNRKLGAFDVNAETQRKSAQTRVRIPVRAKRV